MIDEQAVERPRHPRRNFFIVLILLVVVGLLVWRCTHASQDAAGGQGGRGGRGGRGQVVTTVGTAKATNADVPEALTAIGTVQPVVAATVRTQLNGTIFSLNFTEGQRVAKGQLLAQVDPRPYRLALAQAQGNLARDQALLNQARVDLQRYQTLLQQESIARQQVETQAALVKQDEGTVETDRAAVGTAQLNLNYTAIKAPVSGTVGLRQVDLGNYVTPGDANGIVVVTQSDPIDVAFALPQAQLPQVQAHLRPGGSPLEVDALDQAGGAVLAHGRFLTFDNAIDATTGTVKAKARFANPGGRLFPNQFVNVSLLVDTLRNAVVVPVAAVRNGSDGDFVFVLNGRTVKLTKVKSGPTVNGQIAILSGVQAGQTVVTEGADQLDDGATVALPGDKPKGRWGGKGGKGGGHRHAGGGGNGGGGAGGGR